MRIPDCFVWIMESCTGVKIYCAEELREKIAEQFTMAFQEEYEKIMDLIEEEEGDCHEKDEGSNPFNGATITDYGIFLGFDAFAMHSAYGDSLSFHNAGEALEKALKTVKTNYPSIRYEGYVAYCRSDTHGGDVVQYEISSEKKSTNETVFDFIGEDLEFALMDEYLWEEGLPDELESLEEEELEEELKNILKLFHMYSAWIPADATERLLALVEDIDEDLREPIEEYISALESGVDEMAEEDDEDTDDLPDGYMEALGMFMMAEELGAPKPKRGETISSDGTFDLVIRAAEAGDAEAKFTAGKYFIADHVEEETERAVQWFREAAEEGVEEAEIYLSKHSELFE